MDIAARNSHRSLVFQFARFATMIGTDPINCTLSRDTTRL